MKASHLDFTHVHKTLVIGTGGKRKRGEILDLDLTKRSHVVATIRFAYGTQVLPLAFDTDIEVET